MVLITLNLMKIIYIFYLVFYFFTLGKIYFFDPGDIELNIGDNVIVETAMGEEFGEVVTNERELPDEKITNPLKQVVRIATPQDIKSMETYKSKEPEALKICEEKIF